MHRVIYIISLCMEHFIIVLHQHCNHAFQKCIIIRAIKHWHYGWNILFYSLAWWLCNGIKKHVLCNSSDNIILSKDIPKTPPKVSFRITLTCYSWALWWISMTFAFLVLRSLCCEDLITLSQHHSLLCLTFSSWTENLTSLNYPF